MSIVENVKVHQTVQHVSRVIAVGAIILVIALIVFAHVGLIVAGAIAIGGTFLPGDLPHVDTPDTLPGPSNVIAQTASATSLSLNPAGINWKVPPK